LRLVLMTALVAFLGFATVGAEVQRPLATERVTGARKEAD
jgi:hypothetical protein